MAIPHTLRLHEVRLNRLTSPDGQGPPRTVPPLADDNSDAIATTSFVRQVVQASTFQFPPGSPGQVWTLDENGQPGWRLPASAPSFQFPAGTVGQVWTVTATGPAWQTLNLPQVPQLVAGANVTVEYNVPAAGQIRISAAGQALWYIHPSRLEQNLTVRAGQTMVVGGPFEIADGVTLTVEPGGTLVVV